MPLTGKHFRRIQDALLEAYDDFALKQMVRFELDDSLDRIAGQGNLEQRVFGLIDWADRAGRVDELVQAACRHNDSSPALKALLAEWPQITGQMQPAQPGEGRRIDVQVSEPIFIDFVSIGMSTYVCRIARTTVTNAEYAIFQREVLNAKWVLTDPNQPAKVDWYDAVAYCQWAARILRKEIRLPTGSELREACGTDPADRLRIFAAKLCGSVVRCHVYGHGR